MQHNREKYTFNFNLFLNSLTITSSKKNPKVQTVLHTSSIHFNTPVTFGLDRVVTTITTALSILFLPLDMVTGEHICTCRSQITKGYGLRMRLLNERFPPS